MKKFHNLYLETQLITYMGNKRKLLPYIEAKVFEAKEYLHKDKLLVADLFSGSGVVSRLLKYHASEVIANDLEAYAEAVSKSYLTNTTEVDWKELTAIVEELNATVLTAPLPEGIIAKFYAPKDDQNITKDDRVFYTTENAKRIDNYRRMLDELPEFYKRLLLGGLLAEASVHSNTSGFFNGFLKDRHTGLGKFGGTYGDSLGRILSKVELRLPVLCPETSAYTVYREDVLTLAPKLHNLDLVYLDPPYNDIVYGSRYHLLNLITIYELPKELSDILGIVTGKQIGRAHV